MQCFMLKVLIQKHLQNAAERLDDKTAIGKPFQMARISYD